MCLGCRISADDKAPEYETPAMQRVSLESRRRTMIEQDERIATESANDEAANGHTCPDCSKPITLQRSGWWTHDGLPGDCWRQSMDGPAEHTIRTQIMTIDDAEGQGRR